MSLARWRHSVRRVVNGSRTALAWGPHNYVRRHRWTREMCGAAAALPTLPIACEPASWEIHYLTGRRHWQQSAFCHTSLLLASGEPIAPVFHSDGSLGPVERDHLRRLFPEARLPDPRESEARLDQCLPRERFPALREQRGKLVFLRKLLDVHAGATGPALVLDSDVLFWRRPDALLAWLRRPSGHLVLQDVGTFYGYSEKLLHRVAGGALPARVNAGLVAVPERARLDWDWLEAALRELVACEGLSYYLEQAIDAMIYARGGALRRLDEREYRVAPATRDTRAASYAMGHFVASSRMAYLKFGWRVIAARAAVAAA